MWFLVPSSEYLPWLWRPLSLIHPPLLVAAAVAPQSLLLENCAVYPPVIGSVGPIIPGDKPTDWSTFDFDTIPLLIGRGFDGTGVTVLLGRILLFLAAPVAAVPASEIGSVGLCSRMTSPHTGLHLIPSHC